MRINNNIPALKSLNSLNVTNAGLDRVLERLSTGKRINRAADDAAGLAIAQKMSSQVRGLEIAKRNSNDGISLIQTAEGALTEVHDMLQRMRELCIQASNGTMATEDRKAIDNEVTQLKNEIERISDTTEFNDMKLLNGDIDRKSSSSDITIASVIGMSDTVNPNTYSLTIATAASQTTFVGDPVAGMFNASDTALIGGTLNINGEEVTIDTGDTTNEVFAKIRDLCSTVEIDVVTAPSPFDNGSSLTLTHQDFGSEAISITGNASLLTALGIGGTATPAVTAGQDVVVTGGSLSASFPSGTTVTTSGKDIILDGPDDFELILEGGTATGAVSIDILSTGPLDLQIGANEGQFMEIRIPNLSPKALGLNDLNLSTTESAQEAIASLDDAINTISSVRSKLGAFQNRLEHTIKSLSVAAENMTASLSRIEDADMAFEMAEYTKKNVLSQAGVSMLAQANQRPQSILQLLQQ